MAGFFGRLPVWPGREAGPDRHDPAGGAEAATATRAPWFSDPWLAPRLAVLGIVLAVPLVFAPSRGEVFAPIKVAVLHAGLGLGLVAVALALLRRGHTSQLALTADLAVAGFTTLYLVGYLFSLDQSVGLRGEFPEYQGLTTIMAYAGLYLLARLSFSEPAHLQQLFVVLSVVTAVIGGYALIQRLGLDPIWGSDTRPFATVGQANSMATVLLVGLPATVATAVRCRGTLRVLAWAAAALGFFGLLASLSRGGWLGLTAATVIAFLFHRPLRRRTILLAAFTAAATVALLLAVSAPGQSLAQDARERLTATVSGDESVDQHLTLWKLGAVITADRPWTGVGPAAFPHVALQYADEHLTESEYASLQPYFNESPHNGLLSISTDAGLPALAAYLVLVSTVGIRAVRAGRAGDALAIPVLTILVGYLVASQFITPEVSSSTAAWGVLGAACGTLPTGPCTRCRLPA